MTGQKINQEALQHREALKAAKLQYYQGQITQEQLFTIADQYIAFLRRRQAEGLKIRIPKRTYLIRAI